MKAIGSGATTVDEAKADAKVAAAIQAGIDKANANAASRAQKIQKFVVLDGDLSVVLPLPQTATSRSPCASSPTSTPRVTPRHRPPTHTRPSVHTHPPATRRAPLLTFNLSLAPQVPGGELTATQKLKRDVVNKKYAAQIESMYAEKA